MGECGEMSKLFSTNQVLMILALIGVSIGNGRSCMEHERAALLSIRSDIPSDWLAAWTEFNCCSWAGITCDKTTGHVIGLDLHNPFHFDYNVRHSPNKVNTSLSQLSHLKYLDFSMNNFDSAPILDSITSLHNLHYLNLSNANFNGTIPSQLGNLNHLRYLDLNCEQEGSLLTDDLRWLPRIPHLQYLDLSGVNLFYSDWLNNINMLTSISVLKLRSSNLEEIPAIPGQQYLSSLTILDLSLNNFNSTMPSWLLNITSLVDIRLSSNGFHGEIPNTLVSLNNLQHVELDKNNLDWTMPESLGNLSNLVYLDLSSNQIEGKLPESLGNLSSLVYLNLSLNQIGGKIPESIGNLSRLSYLDIHNNYLTTGIIPHTLGNNKMLEYLDLSFNSIHGEIPNEITELRGLVYLLLSDNTLSGNIPLNISVLVNLKILDLSCNNLSGSIPTSLASLPAVNFSDFSLNNLSGKVPTGIDPWVFRCNPNIFLSFQVQCNVFYPDPENQVPNVFSPASEYQMPDQENQDDSKFTEIIWTVIGFAPGCTVGFWGFVALVLMRHERRKAYFQLIDTASDWIYKKAVMPGTWIYRIISQLFGDM